MKMTLRILGGVARFFLSLDSGPGVFLFALAFVAAVCVVAYLTL